MEIVKIIIKTIIIIYGIFFGSCLLLAVYYNIFKKEGKR